MEGQIGQVEEQVRQVQIVASAQGEDLVSTEPMQEVLVWEAQQSEEEVAQEEVQELAACP